MGSLPPEMLKRMKKDEMFFLVGVGGVEDAWYDGLDVHSRVVLFLFWTRK